MTITTINPATNQPINTYPTLTQDHIDTAIDSAHAGHLLWAKTTIEERVQLLRNLAQIIIEQAATVAPIASQEMGKPITQGIAELEKCARAIHYYADNATQFLQPQKVTTEFSKSYVSYQPLGVVLAIMPWNFPFWQVFRAIGPILIGGNSMLLKHASNVSGCALAIQEMMDLAGFPQGVFQSLIIHSSQVENIIAHPFIQAVTFTGSTAVGKTIAATAGKYLKKQVLELGGSDAYIINEDADIALAVKELATSRLNNAGQSCIGAKRFIVHQNIAKQFTEEIVTAFTKYETLQNPLDSTTTLGPMTSVAARNELHEQVLENISLGAQLLCGGYIPEHPGAYYPPTVIANINATMPAYRDELFGPVATIITAKDIEEAIRIANDTAFGLGAGIFSSNVAWAEQIANERLHAGSVAVNQCVHSDPRMPFGGIKESGYGRELSEFGFREFVNIKSVVVS